MPTLVAYHRPESVEEALQLLARDGVQVVAVAGGTHAVAELSARGVEEVVDLQALNLGAIETGKIDVTIGAMATLQALTEHERLPAIVREAAYREGPNTLRHAATIGGTIARGESTSELLAALLIHEAQVDVAGSDGMQRLPLADLLRALPAVLAGGLIIAVRIGLAGGACAMARVACTPTDAPIVAAAARRAPDGRTLLALCGVAATPVLVDPASVDDTIDPPGDFRGSPAYRREMAHVLTNRVLAEVAA